MSIVPQQKELVFFFLGRETFEVTLRILADKHLLLNGYFIILSPDSSVGDRFKNNVRRE